MKASSHRRYQNRIFAGCMHERCLVTQTQWMLTEEPILLLMTHSFNEAMFRIFYVSYSQEF